MLQKISVRALALLSVALILVALLGIFLIFGVLNRGGYEIVLPKDRETGATIEQTDRTVDLPLKAVEELTLSNGSLPAVLKTIPVNQSYQIHARYAASGQSLDLVIFAADGKIKINEYRGRKLSRHVLILSDGYYTWRPDATRATKVESSRPFEAAGYGFLDISRLAHVGGLRLTKKGVAISFPSVSFSQRRSDGADCIWTVSTENGCVYQYTCTKNGVKITDFLITARIDGEPAEANFQLPQQS